jgi:hypothetical protein
VQVLLTRKGSLIPQMPMQNHRRLYSLPSFLAHWLTLNSPTEPILPPQQPVLEDVRPVRPAAAGQAHGFAQGRGDGYVCGVGERALS